MSFLRVCFGFSGRMNRCEYAIMIFGSMIAPIAGIGLAVAVSDALGDGAAATLGISLVRIIRRMHMGCSGRNGQTAS